MNHFVLDANTVIAEQYGASAHMRALLSASSAVGFQVHFPKVAWRKLPRDTKGNCRRIRKKQAEVYRDCPRYWVGL